MKKADHDPAIRVEFTPESHGWASCNLSIGGISHHIASVSDTTEPLADLLRAALMIATGAPRATVSMDAEPMETRWVLEAGWWDRNRYHYGFRVRLLEFENIHRPIPEADGDVVFEANPDEGAFIRAVLSEAERLRRDFPDSWLVGNGALTEPGSAANIERAFKALKAVAFD